MTDREYAERLGELRKELLNSRKRGRVARYEQAVLELEAEKLGFTVVRQVERPPQRSGGALTGFRQGMAMYVLLDGIAGLFRAVLGHGGHGGGRGHGRF